MINVNACVMLVTSSVPYAYMHFRFRMIGAIQPTRPITEEGPPRMARLHRKEVARPRGRPTSKELPVILPFPGSPTGDAPEPLMRFHGYYVVNGVPIHLVGERWRTEDSGCCPSPVTPDPFNPEVMLASWLESDLKGAVILAVSCEEYQERVAASRGSLPPQAGTSKAR